MIAKILIGGVLLCTLLFCGVVGALYQFQRNLIYPVPLLDTGLPEGFLPITYQTSDGLNLQAGYRPPEQGRPVLLFFHGNGVDWKSTYHTTKLLSARGYGVLAAEYRGYGGNPGNPTEEGLYRDGRAALGWLREQGVADGDIVLVGNSLGSGVATELARHMQARALVLISAFKSMTATASGQYPWAPVGWLLQDRYDNIAKIGEVTYPVLVVHGSEDRLIPLGHASELAGAAPSARLVKLAGMGHNLSGEVAAQVPQLQFLDQLVR